MTSPPSLTRTALLELIDDMRAAVAAGDSFEGRMTYETCGPGTYRADIAYRVGNLMGQGGMVFVTTDPLPHSGEIETDYEPEPA